VRTMHARHRSGLFSRCGGDLQGGAQTQDLAA
jgi:hypothetical protein